MDDRLQNTRAFLEELDELGKWLSATMDLLKTQHGPVGSVTSDDGDDSIIVDPKVRVTFLSYHDDMILRIICKDDSEQNYSFYSTTTFL